MLLNKKIQQISPSSTLYIEAKAKQMKTHGIDVISLSAGEPDFDTPDEIKNKAKLSIDQGFTKYTPSSGILELKNAICEKLKKENNLDYSTSEIIVSCGAKHSLYNIFQVLCNEDDEVILPSPYWVSYLEQIKLASAKPVIVETLKKNNFKITKNELKKAITSKTKLFILNSPNNPTGAVYSKNELEEIAQVLVEKNIFCISDEIYEKLIYDNKVHISIASLNNAIKELCLIVNGVSKTYAMTGWRIGYLSGKKEIISAIDTLQSHSTSNPCSISQKAALEAFSYSSQKIEIMKNEFEKRRNYMCDFFNTFSNLSCIKPEGAFYLFVDISKLLGKSFFGKKIKSAADLAEYLLEKAKVAVVPGEGFGKNDHIRLSYATSMENIINACNRIKEALKILE